MVYLIKSDAEDDIRDFCRTHSIDYYESILAGIFLLVNIPEETMAVLVLTMQCDIMHCNPSYITTNINTIVILNIRSLAGIHFYRGNQPLTNI